MTLRRMTRKSLGLLLSIAMTISMTPVSAFALDGPITITPEDSPAEISENVNGTVEVTTINPEGEQGGNVSATVNGSIVSQDDNEYCGLAVSASDGNTATVTTKDITYTGEEGGAIIAINDSGTAKVTVNGNVIGTDGGIGVDTSAGKTEIAITGNINGGIDGIVAETYEGGQADFAVTGNVSGADDGIYAKTYKGGQAGFVVKGNVSSETDGIYANTYGSGEASITVTGDVEGKERGLAIRAANPKPETGISDEGTTTVTVDGDVKGHKDGVYAYVMTGASAKINVTGDLISDGYGLNAVTWGKNDNIGKVDVLVEGTIDAGEVGIALRENYKTNINVTAWKITPNKDGWVAGNYKQTDNERVLTGEDEDFEKTINYIIKVEQPAEGATLTASQGTAHEGDSVALKIDLQDGYYITGAFSNEGKSIPLLKDASGNYYVVVPKGGGVYLSVTLYKIPSEPEAEAEPELEPYIPVKTENAASTDSQTKPEQSPDVNTTPAVTAADISAQIANALAIDPSAASVSLDLGVSPSIGAEVLSTLCEKSTIEKSCSFTVDGKKYTLIIPAFDADSELYKQCLALLALEPGGVAGPIRLAQIFAALGFRIVEG